MTVQLRHQLCQLIVHVSGYSRWKKSGIASGAMTDALLIAEARAALRSGCAAQARKEAQLTQLEVAGAVGVSRATYRMWESGERVPRGAAAERLALFLRALRTTVAAVEA